MRFFQTLKNVNFMTNTEKKDSVKEPEWVVSVAVYFCLIRSSIAVGPTLFLSNSANATIIFFPCWIGRVFLSFVILKESESFIVYRLA